MLVNNRTSDHNGSDRHMNINRIFFEHNFPSYMVGANIIMKIDSSV